MTWLAFFAEIFKAAIWPAVVIFVVIRLHAPIADLIRSLKKVKKGDLEFEFGLEKLEEESLEERAKQKTLITTEKVITFTDRQKNLLAISPEAAMLDTWRELEMAAVDASKRLAISLPQVHSIHAVIAKLHYDGFITTGRYRFFNELQKLRNIAAHSPSTREFTTVDATRFMALVSELVAELKALTPESRDPRNVN